ncbi:23S rRNA (uracil-5-)-methyltransferase RumA [Bacillus sp. FJAT-27264]|uniref:23S rRNA (uracil(1939)-C(5))-methyltransferase RlmD n=1 Tax=Paenibacillus sp. (strain DSM 101736 / FJAT-27264) TaxID=1850362 RepID=UPI000807B31B|nr:23S rRNA (uracil(1939)-C(5))-methyltransferase RlmD [Bacillus sp. FJAT-27264]OBZ07547.1 23S rRNA (uracil-5-)-methyltransferase RumA [Bacillus sp. FJAT-27264]
MSRHRSGRNTSRRDGTAQVAGLPVNKNDEVMLDIIGMTHEGEGVGRVEGFTLFVQGALPGEKIRAKVLKTKKQYGYAKLLKIEQASGDRIAPPCEIYDMCGGCQLQHMDYAAQLAWKRQLVVDNLERIGKLQVAGGRSAAGSSVGSGAGVAGQTGGSANGESGGASSATVSGNIADVAAGNEDADAYTGIIVRPTLGMDEPWRYRNKAQVPIGDSEGGLVGGFYARGSHRIIDMETCLIQHEENDNVVRRVKEIGRRLGITAYDEETGKGLLRHVVVRVAFATGEMMVVLVTNGDRIPCKDEWIAEIRRELPAVTSICQNVNTRQTNVIFGDVTRTLWGSDVIYDYIGDVKFAISARSFYQVNPAQTEVLYGKTVEYAGLAGNETVIDAYCGIGTISLFLAQHAKQVYGVEIVPEAIEDARANARLNDMNNVVFEVGASEDVIPNWKEQGITPDVIVVDPPRKGCDARLLETILAMQPKKVVYVSCNPSTLARDLRVLEDGGYRTVEVQPVDMFPHTVHVESVALLVRNGTEGGEYSSGAGLGSSTDGIEK